MIRTTRLIYARTSLTPELAEILADGPISHVMKSKVSELGVVAKDGVGNEDAGGVFELNEWV